MITRNRSGHTGAHRGPATVCKTCGHSIFAGQLTRWVTSPLPGLAHLECQPTPNEKT